MSSVTQAAPRAVMPAPRRPVDETAHMFFAERSHHFAANLGSNTVYHPYYCEKSVYDGSIVIVPSNESVRKVKFVTDRLEFVPVENNDTTVAFYEEHLLGNKVVMEGFGSGSIFSHDQVVDRVAELAKSWDGEKYASAFTVRDGKTKELIGSAVFDRARTSNEHRFQVLVKPTLNDGTPAWNKRIGTEITAAMFEGWAVFLTGKPAGEKGPAFDTFNDFRPWNADKSLQMQVLTADAAAGSPAYKILSHMISAAESTANTKSFETARSGRLEKRFFTTPDEMRNLRVDRQIMLEMPAPRGPTPPPINQFDAYSPSPVRPQDLELSFDFGTPDGYRGSSAEVPFMSPSFDLDEGLSRLDLGRRDSFVPPEMPSFVLESVPPSPAQTSFADESFGS